MSSINKDLAGALAATVLLGNVSAHAFNYDGTNYAVYEVANSNGTKTLYIAPKVVPWLIGAPKSVVVLQYPRNPVISGGYSGTLFSNGALGSFSAADVTAANMPSLG